MSPTLEVTIAAWIKTNVASISPWIYDRVEMNDGYGLRLNAQGQARLTINGGQQDVVSNTVVSDNQWHHLAATYNASEGLLKIYVDGVEEKVSAFTSAITYSPEPRNSIGGSTLGSGNYFNGDIDELRIYNRAIGACEVRELADYNPNFQANQDLIGFFYFSGNAQDSSGFGNNGTSKGPMLTQDRFGNPFQAYQFDGIDDVIDIESYTNMSPTNAVSISAWIQTNSAFNSPWIYDRIETNDGYGLRLNSTGQLRLTINGGQQDAVSNQIVSDNVWHHVVGTYDKDIGILRVYVDGVEDGYGLHSTAITYTPQPRNSIGGSSTQNNFFNGKIDDLRIYNKALAPCEVDSLYRVIDTLTPSCLPPFGLFAGNIAEDSVTIGWNTGGAINWQVNYGAVGFDPWNGGLISTSTMSYTATGLTPGTSYHFYVRDSCDVLDVSEWVGPFSITTLSCPATQASFNYSQNGFNLNLDGSSSTGGDQWNWSFGDGTSDTGSSVSHTFLTAGTFDVQLIHSNWCGSDTIIQTFNFCDTLVPVLSFSQMDSAFTFTSNTLGATSVSWQYGDGVKDSGIVVNHVYSDTGVYHVVLVVENLCGDIDSTSITVRVCSSPVSIWSYIVISHTSQGMTVQFDGSSSVSASNYYWDFGDGNSMSGATSPIHTYTVTGVNYNVCLTVENSCLDSNALCSTLNTVGLISPDKFIDQFDIYPNPASNELIIETQSFSPEIKVEFLNSLGVIVLTESFYDVTPSSLNRIPVTILSNGTYQVRIASGEKSYSKKLIIMH
jgi:PKD repeat protein